MPHLESVGRLVACHLIGMGVSQKLRPASAIIAPMNAIPTTRPTKGVGMVLEQNIFVEGVLPGAIGRRLSNEEMDHNRRPFTNPVEERPPTFW
jgi:hypothetical protein